jgi:catechol 2,3-dioxygenase-like lactoylglutathione lyase family enzyme
MPALAMDHFTVLTDRLDETVAFYQDILGLEPGPRPDFDFPGAWLYCQGRPILHVIAGRPLPQVPGGVLDHMAFTSTGLIDTLARLARRNMRHDLRRLPGAGTWQLFFRDPSGARVEMDFDACENGPDAAA